MKIINREKAIEYINNNSTNGSPIYCDEYYPYYNITFWENKARGIFTDEFIEKFEKVSKDFEEMQELLKIALREYNAIEREFES